MPSYPQEYLDAVRRALLKHEMPMLKERGACRCGTPFPSRVPDNWVPEDFTPREWSEADDDDRRDVIFSSRVRSRTAADDFVNHWVEADLAELAAAGAAVTVRPGAAVCGQAQLEEVYDLLKRLQQIFPRSAGGWPGAE